MLSSSIKSSIDDLSLNDLNELFQIVWDKILLNPQILQLSKDHKDKLDERLDSIESGNAKWKNWDNVRKTFDK
jgi:putative addiction module component (TIGR02574 family)